MKKKIGLSFSFWLSVVCFAQQDAQLSQYFFNKTLFNPAVAGMNHSVCMGLTYRSQWVNFPGAPVTKIVSGNFFLPNLRGGVALNLSSDVLGNESNTQANFSFAKHFNVANGEISGGVGAEFIQKKFGGQWLATDGVSGDNSIPQLPTSGNYADVHAGVYYMGYRGMYVGLSAQHIYSKDAKQFVYDYKPHYYVTAGWQFTLPGVRSLLFKPSLLAKSDGASTIYDINLIAQWNNFIWAGVSYRATDAVIPMAGVTWGNLKFGYSYDVTTSDLNAYSSNSHEFTVMYCHKLIGKKKCTSWVNPRKMENGAQRKCECEKYSDCRLHKAMEEGGYWY